MAIVERPPDVGQPDEPRRLDWSRAIVGDPLPCIACRRPAILRHPETGRPHHKVCDEPVALAPAPQQQTGVILPCRFCRNPASMRGPEGKPEHWTCRAKQESRA
ncbi:hypothetical protein ABZ584_24420 [Streptomyces antibioticus]|uniref:hypothetical protein n=1 Tax=Streptomyces antibioticus TaxID=1890 RepID=UPI0033C8BA67